MRRTSEEAETHTHRHWQADTVRFGRVFTEAIWQRLRHRSRKLIRSTVNGAEWDEK